VFANLQGLVIRPKGRCEFFYSGSLPHGKASFSSKKNEASRPVALPKRFRFASEMLPHFASRKLWE
jgi:hypothetical protein